MKSHCLRTIVIVFGVLTVGGLIGPVGAQDWAGRKFEAGVALGGLNQEALGEKAGGVGGRFSYHVRPYLAVDAVVLHFPNYDGPYGNYTVGLVGLKAGFRLGRIGLFAKVRPGVIHFDHSGIQNLCLDTLALDAGGGFEGLFAGSFVFRFELGSLYVNYHGRRLAPYVNSPRVWGTHNRFVLISLAYAF